MPPKCLRGMVLRCRIMPSRPFCGRRLRKADYSLFSRTLPGSVVESCEFWCASPAVLVRTTASNGAHHSIKWCAPKPRLVRTKHDLGALACLELPSQQRSSGEKTAVFYQKDRVHFPKRPRSFFKMRLSGQLLGWSLPIF